MPTPVIVGAVRTPMVRAGGALHSVPAQELARRVIQELIAGVGVEPAEVDEVILGNAGTPADAPNIGRVASLMAGLPRTVPGVTVHRNCASGLEAILQGADRISAGSSRLLVCGGVENMSRFPMSLPPETNPWFGRLARAKTVTQKLQAFAALPWKKIMPKSALVQGLTDPVCGLNMGRTAENLAREFRISRQAQDQFALESHRRAVAAQESGRLAQEITPVYVPPKYANVVEQDVGPRQQQSMDALAKLKPVFDRRDGTVTAGNACQITDGAAVVLLASEEWAISKGLTPLARLRGHATVGLAPDRMGLGPAFAIPKALDRAGVDFDDVSVFEVNEAFAAQVLAVREALASRRFAEEELGRSQAVGDLGDDRLNPNGGAIALGHPIGATGARLVVTLVAELIERAASFGVASLCVGGGLGSALVMERVK